jgi:hypothetical protein
MRGAYLVINNKFLNAKTFLFGLNGSYVNPHTTSSKRLIILDSNCVVTLIHILSAVICYVFACSLPGKCLCRQNHNYKSGTSNIIYIFEAVIERIHRQSLIVTTTSVFKCCSLRMCKICIANLVTCYHSVYL